MINGVCYEESVLEMKGTENGMLEAEELGLSNGDGDHKDEDNDEEELQREVDRLLEENKQLKRKQLKDKIDTLRRENIALKAQIEADEANSEPSSSTNGNDGKIAIVPFADDMKSQSFIFTSSMGGTLYIKPLDLSSQDLEKLSLDGIIDSMCDYDNSYTYAMGGWSKPLNLSTLCNREKHTQTNGSQTPPNYDYMLPQQAPYHVTPPPHPGGKTTKNNSSTYPRLKCGTTQEDMEARRFVQEFKTRRVAHKLTQSDIGERLNRCTGARYGQSYISRLESMQLSTAIVLRMKPLLNRLLNETENGMFAEPGDGTYHAPLKKRKSNSGSSKSRKNAASQRNAAHSTQFGQEIDDMVHKPQFSRSASMPTMANNTGHWQGYHQQNVQQNPAYQAPHNASNFFITGLMSSLNPGVPMSTSRADGSSCNKSADPMGSALSHSSQLYNPYRMDQPMVEPKHEVIELSPVHPRPPHPSPAHDIPHSAFSPNIHELGSVKSEPQITTLHPPLKPG